MSYIEGFVIAVPAANKQAYEAVARKTAAVFRAHGARRVVECWGDDVPHGKQTDFHRAVKAESGEAIVFSWVEWPSRAARDTGMKAVMADPEMPKPSSMPFDGKRVIFGGFEVLLDSAR